MPEHAHLAVKIAREAAAEALADRLRSAYNDTHGRGKDVRQIRGAVTSLITVETFATISEEEKDWVWRLFEGNMRSLYEASSEGYDANEKRSELFHPESRFLTLRQDTRPPLGYCIFRFDTEETASEDEDDDDLCDVAYCYELQIEPGAQRQGIGRILMDALGRLAGAFKMDKTMLTAFKHNSDAVTFYKRLGSVDRQADADVRRLRVQSLRLTSLRTATRFETDEVDPSQYGIDDVDYVILSKSCN
ncbi:GNAT family acetyltransferase [Rhodotorula taiwanensis]|uniref:N-alpha-acetyltransferase 40 n=1 Tax=Rhodotorula taiwanensis TaxID=741276 RepID=A0A2S5B3S4_9BASI|nr:GNAT family acetyltransferase [Rhodotorula taiwanensis]